MLLTAQLRELQNARYMVSSQVKHSYRVLRKHVCERHTCNIPTSQEDRLPAASQSLLEAFSQMMNVASSIIKGPSACHSSLLQGSGVKSSHLV